MILSSLELMLPGVLVVDLMKRAHYSWLMKPSVEKLSNQLLKMALASGTKSVFFLFIRLKRGIDTLGFFITWMIS